jgi:hypothetical protein
MDGPNDGAIRFDHFELLLGISFRLELSGEPNATYVIESSSDLTSWVRLTTLSSASGLITYTDPQAGLLPARFYRARRVP